MYYVYVLKSLRGGKIYTGFTSKDPALRLKEHNSCVNRYTRENGPWELKYFERFTCKRCAENREKFLKSGVGRKIRDIIVAHL